MSRRTMQYSRLLQRWGLFYVRLILMELIIFSIVKLRKYFYPLMIQNMQLGLLDKIGNQ